MKLFNRRFKEFIYLSVEDRALDNMAPVAREFGSPDYERITTFDRYSFGEITGEQAMEYLGVSLETLHLQMFDAEITIPVPGVAPALKGLFADQVSRTFAIEEMNKAVASSVGADFNLKAIINEGRM